MTNKALHVLVGGLVQGVGYRHATMRQARALELTGWVKNLPDGRVEAWFEGPEESLQAMADWSRGGPALAEVQELETGWMPPTGGYSGFEIRF